MLRFIKLSRPYNALLPLVALVAGYTIADAQHTAKLILVMAIFAVLHGVVTIWNDIEDEAGDKFNGITRMAAVRAAGHRRHYIITISILSAVSLLLGAIVLPFFATVLLCGYLVIGWLYNSRPARLCARPIGSMVVMWLGYGFVPFALGASLGHWSGEVVVLGLAWATARLSLSLLKDYKDAKGDAKAAKKTFLLVYGHRRTAQLSFRLLVLSLATILKITARHHGGLGLLALIAAAIGLVFARAQLFRHDDYKSLHAVFRDGLQYQLLFDVAVVTWLRTS